MNKYCFTSLICLLAWGGIHSEDQNLVTEVIQPVISSSIIQIDSFDEIHWALNDADRDTLVIFDVDEVLITYDDMVLRPPGAQFYPSSWKDIDRAEIPYLLSIMLSEGKIILIDSSTPELVNQLAKRGVKTIALTAARTGRFGVIENAEEWRLRVLKQFKLDFSRSFPENQTIYFNSKKDKDYPLFKDGILFLGDEKSTKGELLIQFLNKIQWKPKRVIFIDDKISHLSSVESALKDAHIAFQGYQYRGVEKLPGEFSEQIAEKQFARLRSDHKWLSDSDIQKAVK